MSDLVQLQKVGSDKEILYIENDEKLQKSFGIYLQKTFKKFHQAYDAEDGLAKFQKHKPKVVIMELNLGGKDPIELIDDIQALNPDTLIITLSDQNDDYELLQTLDMGLAKMLLKPTTFAQVATTLIDLLPVAVQPKVETKQVSSLKKKTDPIKIEPKQQNKQEVPKKQTVSLPTTQKSIEPKKEAKVEEKKIQKELKNDEPPKKELPKVVMQKEKTPKELCQEEIKKISEKKELVEFLNTYKGISIRNHGEIIHCSDDLFEIQVGLTQIIAVKYEKYTILKTTSNKYIYASLHQINLKNGSLLLKEARFLDYKQRDKDHNRFRADKSCKASIFLQKKRVDFSVEYLSFKSAELITENENINFKRGDQFDVTLGFDLSGPNSMIKEKKFVKVFAKAEVIRVDTVQGRKKIVVLLQVNKAGESSLLRYIDQREEEISYEFKTIIRR